MGFYSKIRPWIGIVALVAIGLLMVTQPDMNIEVTGRRQGMKALLKEIWGLPAGLIIIAIGGFLGYRQIKSKPAKIEE